MSVKIEPANAGAHRLLARIYSEQNNFADAERELSRTVELKPSPDAYVELGVVKGQLGNVEGAATAFRKAIALNRRSEPAQMMLGITLRRLDKHADALAHFRKAVALDP